MEHKKLMDEAIEELHGAKEYVKCALKYRETAPVWAKKYYDLAQDELRHADILYRMAEEQGTGSYTALETAYIDADRERYADKLAHVKVIMDSARM